jgi:hypothetical protein
MAAGSGCRRRKQQQEDRAMPFRDAASSRRRGVLGALGLIGTLAALLPGASQAMCLWPQEEGDWVNVDPGARSLARIQLEFVCQDTIVNGQPFPPGPPWYMQAWSKHRPGDWGRVGARKLGNGHIHAVFHQGFATKHVYAKLSQRKPGQLRVHTYVDFAPADGRIDHVMQDWFVKRGG